MKTLILIILSIVSFQSTASDKLSILTGGWSYHSDPDKVIKVEGMSPFQDQNQDYKYNSKHDLLGVRYNDLIVAKFKNSNYKEGYLVAYDNKVGSIDSINTEFSIVLGVVSGYTKQQSVTYITEGISLYVAPTMTTEFEITDRFSISLSTSLIGSKTITGALQFTINL